MHRTTKSTRVIAWTVIAAGMLLTAATGGPVNANPLAAEDDRAGWCPTWQQQYEEQSNVIGVTQDTVFAIRHRGDFSAAVPENSLTAFDTSYRYCRAAIETDVRQTKDGQLVAFHDATVGRMLEPGFDPISLTGSNERLDRLTLAEVHAKRLVNTATRQPTAHTVATIEEMLLRYLDQNGQSTLFLEIKDGSSILPVGRLIQDVAARHPGAELYKRVVLKIRMSEYPEPARYVEALRQAGITHDIRVAPLMAPAIADQINNLPITIPDAPGQSYQSNATRAVALWASQPGSLVQSVEVLVKDSSDFVRTTSKPSPQGDFAAPTELTVANTSEGTMAEMAMVVRANHKALGNFAAVPDYIMWRTDHVRDIGVPNIAQGKNESIPITEAFYHNDSSCCFQLSDRLSQSATAHEFADVRINLAWQRSIGFNVLTTDDADSVDTFYGSRGELSTVATPRTYRPSAAMNSRLSWDLGYVAVPSPPDVAIQAWAGRASGWWGGKVCLWDNFVDVSTSYGWLYNCGHPAATEHGYSDRLSTRVHLDGRMVIQDHRGYCLVSLESTSPDVVGDADWLPAPECDSERARWTWTREGRFRDSHNRFLGFSNNGALYYGLSYGVMKVIPVGEARDEWSKWAIVPHS
ncbi:glycerophosphodiester phosphodiesterase family protein [Plantibacter sp. Mn2098]|uniref:glycerophosphodiester phosphodiesterase family protein n=1 Tax=Plantibacter sp. Mn2098 TaxID=3395266 RepID=UPI003BC254D0